MNKLFKTLSVLAVILLVITAGMQAVQAEGNDRAEKLLGSWSVDVTTPNQGTFPALLTFTADGSVISDESPNPFESSAHGNWISKSSEEVSYTAVALFGGEDGRNTGKLKIVGKLKLDFGKKSWSGPFKIDIFDANGQVVFSDTGTFKLTRIEVEKMP